MNTDSQYTENNQEGNTTNNNNTNHQLEDDSKTLIDILCSHRMNYYQMSDNEKKKVMDLANQIKLDKKIPIKCKPIEYIEAKDHECVICCQPYSHSDRIGECLFCKQQLHQDCLMGWCFESIQSSSQPTCPFCRAIWKDNGKLNYPLISSSGSSSK